MFDFTLHATDGAARTGTFTTPHGNVETPGSMPGGTSGRVKGLPPGAPQAPGVEDFCSACQDGTGFEKECECTYEF